MFLQNCIAHLDWQAYLHANLGQNSSELPLKVHRETTFHVPVIKSNKHAWHALLTLAHVEQIIVFLTRPSVPARHLYTVNGRWQI